MTEQEAMAEQIIRSAAKILVVGSPENFTDVRLDNLDASKTYLLAIMEVKP